MTGIGEFFRAMWQEILSVWWLAMDFLVSIFEPQSGWEPKVIFGGCLLFIVIWIARRGSKST